MKSIYKYSITNQDSVIYTLPEGSQILSAQNQKEGLQVWALVDTRAELNEKYNFVTVNTGENINYYIEGYTFIDTVQLWQGGIVQHVFYKRVG